MQITITPKENDVSSPEYSLDVLTQLYAVNIKKTLYDQDPRRATEDKKNLDLRSGDITPGARYTQITEYPPCFNIEHTGFDFDNVYAIVTVNESGGIVFESATVKRNPSGNLVLEKNPDDISVEKLVADLEKFLEGRHISYDREPPKQ